MNEKKPKAAEAAFSAKSGELRALAEETITEWFNEKHRPRSEAEVAFVNSVAPGSCPHCGSARIRKDGFGNWPRSGRPSCRAKRHLRFCFALSKRGWIA